MGKGRSYYTFQVGRRSWMTLPGGCCSLVLLLLHAPWVLAIIGLLLYLVYVRAGGLHGLAYAVVSVLLGAAGGAAGYLALKRAIIWAWRRLRRRARPENIQAQQTDALARLIQLRSAPRSVPGSSFRSPSPPVPPPPPDWPPAP